MIKAGAFSRFKTGLVLKVFESSEFKRLKLSCRKLRSLFFCLLYMNLQA